MKWVTASSLLLRVLGVSSSHEGCRELLRRTAWGPTGGHEVECNCVCGECEGPAQFGHPPPATPPPPPPLAPLPSLPTLEREHLPTLSPLPAAPPQPWRYTPTPPPPPPPNNTNASNATLLSVSVAHGEVARGTMRVRKASPRAKLCMALLKQIPPPPAECQCECAPCNFRAPIPLLCDPLTPPKTTTEAP